MNELRFAVRALWQSRGFSTVAVLTLALGIGANTAIFSVIYAVLLHATPYPDSDRLVRVHESVPAGSRLEVAPRNFQDWKSANTVFERLALFRTDNYMLTAGEAPVPVMGAQASADLFPILGVKPVMGRLFSPSDDQPGSARVVLVAHGFWQQRFGGDLCVIGRVLNLGREYSVIGVMPAAFDFPEHAQLWIPAGLSYGARTWQSRTSHFMSVVGKLKQGVTLAQAQSNMNAIASNLARTYPDSNQGVGVWVAPLRDEMVRNVRPALLALLAGVGFVLLIASANVANLLLGRAVQRRKDWAIRLALGASRGRIVRQLLAESVILALVGGLFGIVFAVWSIGSVVALVRETLPRAAFIEVNWPVLAFTLAASLFTGILVAVAPGWQSSKSDLNTALKDAGQAVPRHRSRSALVVCEIAFSFVLLIGAGLMVRTFIRLAGVDLGFKPDHILTMHVGTSNVEPILRSARDVPGVLDAAVTNPLPVSDDGWQDVFVRQGEPQRTMNDASYSDRAAISPGYFSTMRIPLLAGRDFDRRDGEPGREVAIVDEFFAKRYAPSDGTIIGQRLKFSLDPASSEPWVTIVGVVGHVNVAGPESHWAGMTRVQSYIPYRQYPFPGYTFVIRTSGDPAAIARAVEISMRGVDRGLPISKVRTMEEWVGLKLQYRRFSMLLLSIFAAIGLLLALVGVYGVMAYSVTQRLREFGIRMALGAERQDVFKIVLGNAAKLAAIGLAAGFVLALALSRWLAQLVFGVSPTDTGTFISVALILAAAALLACYIPARRATRIDPMVALRYE